MTMTVVAPPGPALESGTGDSSLPPRLYAPAFVLAGVTGWLLWIGVTTLERNGNLGRSLGSGWAVLVAPMVVSLVVVVFVCERFWPAERRDALARGHRQDAAFFALHVVAVVPIMTLLGVAFGHLLGSDAGWIGIPWSLSWPHWLLLVVTLVLMDGSNWLAHWADHRLTPLWRMHALHHSQEELSVLTSFRAHPLSHLPGFLLATVPVIVLMGDGGMAPVLITCYVCLGTLPHANLPWTFGPLGRVVVSPAYHRLHHSIEGPQGFNLGVVLTVWDVLAGRALFPHEDMAVCRTGLARRPLPVEQAEDGHARLGLMLVQLVEPFRAASPATARRHRSERRFRAAVQLGTGPIGLDPIRN
jgi:sterol desaturase/sphingolipid hydroxylase (fatty acid hydroxylase superfamily)